MKSILTKNQKRKFEREMVIDGEPAKMIVTIRYDDECNNGHNSFAITAHLYDRGCIRGEAFTTLSTGKKRWLGSCGCLHEEIAKYARRSREDNEDAIDMLLNFNDYESSDEVARYTEEEAMFI
jgi:hypothetical protein